MCDTHVGLDALLVAHWRSPLCTGRDHFGKFDSPLSLAVLLRMLPFVAWSSGQPALPVPLWPQSADIPLRAPTPSSLPSSVPAILKSIRSPVVALPRITVSVRALYLLFLLVASVAHLHLSAASDTHNTSTILDYEPVHHHHSSERRVFESSPAATDYDDSADNVVADIDSKATRMPSVDQWPLASRNVLNQSTLGGNGTRLVNRLWPHANMSARPSDALRWRPLATAAPKPDNLPVPLSPFITVEPNFASSNVSSVLAPAIATTTTSPWPHLSSNITKLVANVSAYVTHPQAGILSAGHRGNSTEVPNSTALFIADDSQTTIVLEPDLRIHHPILAVLLGLICVIVIFGNVLTMLAIYKMRYLHTVTNYFVASLAAADCLMGTVVMPFSVVHEVMNKWWIFGQDWCDLWHSFDVLASTASILNLCVISLDRYWAITDPITYPSRMTPARASFFIFIVWFSSALISFPAIVWWRAVQKEPLAPYRCLFTDDVGYLVFSSTISFYGPLTVMVFTYYRIYVIATQQTKNLKIGMKQIEMSSITEGGSGTSSECPSSGFTLRMHRGGYQLNSSATSQRQHGNISYHSVSHDKLSSLSKSEYDIKASMDQLPHNGECGNFDGSGNSQAGRHYRNHKANWSVPRRLQKLAKEKKAAKTLAIIMGVFTFCWLPFFLLNVLIGICPEKCVPNPDLVYSVVTWMGWTNSAYNPAIYAIMNADFRRAFRKILCSCFASSSNLSYDRNRIYKAPHNRYNNYYYKTKVKRDPNADFNFNTSQSARAGHSAKSNTQLSSTKLKTVPELEASNGSHSPQPFCSNDASAAPPVDAQVAGNGNGDNDAIKKKTSNELPLASNVLHMAKHCSK